MKVGPIVLKLRLQNTRFENRIGGAAELAAAMTYTLQKEMAFVVQMAETTSANNYDAGINQVINERFAVIVALDNAISDKDKLGLTAYDTLFDIRAEIFHAILGWQMPDAESLVSYAGGRVVRVDRAYLWYQFEFLVSTRISDGDGVDVGAADLGYFDSIYAQWILTPSAKMDVIGDNLPITIVDPDMTSIIDFTTNPAVNGDFSKAFGLDFDTYKPIL
jgi:hypothetical protein